MDSISRGKSALTPAVFPLRSRSRGIQQLPNSQVIPPWLRSLVKVQRFSSIAALSLTAAVLAVYGQVVYAQHLWNQEYRKLETLQRHERQLTTANEGLKDQLAKQAENPKMNLALPTPANNIFMPPAPLRPSPTVAPTPTQLELAPDTVIGY
ncbi:MAG: hypothetical protein VKJ46_13245 [Leptolyngbyaceae bacterium]|nr:hypothetical protein [Leptolyngbyaceae bacterium]